MFGSTPAVPAGGPTPGCSSPGGLPISARRPSSSWPEPRPFSTARRSGRKRARLATSGHRGRLVLLELTVIRLAWTFNFDYSRITPGRRHLDARLVHDPARCPPDSPPVGRGNDIGVAIVGLHNLTVLHARPPLTRSRFAIGPCDGCGTFLYFGGGFQRAAMAVLYQIVPWIGVMALEFAFQACSSSRRRAGGRSVS